MRQRIVQRDEPEEANGHGADRPDRHGALIELLLRLAVHPFQERIGYGSLGEQQRR